MTPNKILAGSVLLLAISVAIESGNLVNGLELIGAIGIVYSTVRLIATFIRNDSRFDSRF